jgi:molybdenum cofactor biosynthesis enzyme
LQTLAESTAVNSSTKRTKRDDRRVAYIRLNAKEHAQISKIALKRGRPHTFASVAAEMISKALKMESRE